MAKGRKCPERGCGMSMFAEKDDDQREGRWVTYVCTGHDPRIREKVFESYADRR